MSYREQGYKTYQLVYVFYILLHSPFWEGITYVEVFWNNVKINCRRVWGRRKMGIIRKFVSSRTVMICLCSLEKLIILPLHCTVLCCGREVKNC